MTNEQAKEISSKRHDPYIKVNYLDGVYQVEKWGSGFTRVHEGKSWEEAFFYADIPTGVLK